MRSNEDYVIEQILESGWLLHSKDAHRTSFYRKNKELQELFGGDGLEFITVFKDGTTQKGIPK